MTTKQQEIEPKIKPAPKKEEQLKSLDPSINPIAEPSKIKQKNEKVFQSAHGERKALNIQKLREYMAKRVESFQERNRICDFLRANLFEKQKNTRAFLKNIIKFFEDYASLYSSLSKSISKLELRKKFQNHVMYSAIKESIGQMIKLNDQQIEHVNKFVDWLQKILIEAFKAADAYFKQRMKKINKDVENSQSNFSSSWSKQQKAYEKLSDGNDLMQKQLMLMENIKNSNETSITRASELNQAWEFLLEQQNTIKRLLKDNILQFHQRFVKFHKKTDSATNIFKYWSNLPASPTAVTVYASFLDDKSVNYINFGGKTKKLSDNFETFMRMVFEQARVGNPHPLLDILIVKKYSSKMQLTQRDWKQIKLIFTVDHHLLLYDEKEGKVILKLMQNNIKLKRISQNILQLNGVEQGIVFNSKKKESIHFQTLDEVQQFIYYVNSIPERKDDQK